MGYSAKVLQDSLSSAGCRLTTMEITYPRMVHSEFMTHRCFSRNAASSRAIPIQKMIHRVLEDPVIPVWWGRNQSGMQAREELQGEEREKAIETWLRGRDEAVSLCNLLVECQVHKQIANRVLEPWMWITVIVSATEWVNFIKLRCHLDAQPEIQKIAYMMRDAREASVPKVLGEGEWHLPLTFEEDLSIPLEDRIKVSVGRCARVSYLTHDGVRDPQKDIELHDRLIASGHWSPTEHAACAQRFPSWSGNFCGWTQYRKSFVNENGDSRG